MNVQHTVEVVTEKAILKEKLQAVSSFITTLLVIIILAAPFIGLAAGLALRFFHWVAP